MWGSEGRAFQTEETERAKAQRQLAHGFFLSILSYQPLLFPLRRFPQAREHFPSLAEKQQRRWRN